MTDYEDRADHLVETTTLKRREAEVRALKEEGETHEQIAERLGIAKNTVDEYSRRVNDRVRRSRATLAELDVAAEPEQGAPVDDVAEVARQLEELEDFLAARDDLDVVETDKVREAVTDARVELVDAALRDELGER